MSSLKKELQARAGDLTDVEIRPGRSGAPVAFWVNGKEFARLQQGSSIEIRLPKARIERLKPDYRLQRERNRDWLVVHFETEEDLDFVLRLLEKAYREAR